MILDNDNKQSKLWLMFSQSSQEKHVKENNKKDCVQCVHNNSQLILWLRQNQHRKQNNIQIRHIRVTHHILSKSRGPTYINFKEAVLSSTSERELDSLGYKDWGRIVNEIKSSILRNLQINKGGMYDKMYIHSQIMLKNLIKKKILTAKKLQSKYNPQRIHSSNNTQRSNGQRILLNSQLRTCYNFYPVDKYQYERKSSNQNNIHQSLSQSQMEMQRLKSQLSIMINQIKQFNHPFYEQNIDFTKTSSDSNLLTQQIKFKTKLAANYSDIIHIDIKNYQHNQKGTIQYQGTTDNKVSNAHSKKNINQNQRMYTSPDLGKGNNSYIENKYAEMYGCLMKKQSKGKGISKSKDKKGPKKLNQNDEKSGINNINSHYKKNSQLGMLSTTASGGNLTNTKSKSKSKLKPKPSLSSTSNKLTVHISSPRGHNKNMTNGNHNNTKRLTDVKSVSRNKLGNGDKSVGKSTTRRGVQKQKQ